jgi:hypothetical protein
MKHLVKFEDKKPCHKFPFFYKIAEAMEYINAEEKLENDMDTKSLLLFFKLYFDSCKYLIRNGKSTTKDNIVCQMESRYQKIRTELYSSPSPYIAIENKCTELFES